jgi:hypothetical protein
MVALIAMAYCMEPVSCKAAVIITNGMTESLTVHCHSADNDLGVHILGTNAPPYVFEFNENLWGTTLFTCDFGAAGKREHSIIVWEASSYFPPYDCWRCHWDVSNTGFYVEGVLFQAWPSVATESVEHEKVSCKFCRIKIFSSYQSLLFFYMYLRFNNYIIGIGNHKSN